jgi:hypothetical protein
LLSYGAKSTQRRMWILRVMASGKARVHFQFHMAVACERSRLVLARTPALKAHVLLTANRQHLGLVGSSHLTQPRYLTPQANGIVSLLKRVGMLLGSFDGMHGQRVVALGDNNIL